MNANGGGWQHLLTNTQYPNDPGHQYTFRVTATDRVGNVGQGQASAIVTAVTRYYYFGGKRVAMRGPDDAVVWLHGDHLGSTSLATDAAQAVVSRQLYYPFGEQRWASAELPTDFQFTGQRIDAYIKLYQMGARWYDPQIGRWISPDTIIPDPANPQSLNRYSYVRNRPLNRIDPSGHQDEPAQNLPEWVQQVIEHLQGRGWHVVGDPSQVHPNWNGADQVFTDAPAEWTRVLGVEL